MNVPETTNTSLPLSNAGLAHRIGALVGQALRTALVLVLLAVLWTATADVSAAQSGLQAEEQPRLEAYADIEVYHYPTPFYAKYKLRKEGRAVGVEIREEVQCGDEYTVLSAGLDWVFTAQGVAECERGRQLLAEQIRRTSHSDAGGATKIPEDLSRAIDSIGKEKNGLIDPNWHFQSSRNQPDVQERQFEVRLDDWVPGAETAIDSTRWQERPARDASRLPFGADGVIAELVAMESLWSVVLIVASVLAFIFLPVWWLVRWLATFATRQALRLWKALFR